MRFDGKAVGGFFEDLPVLAVILTGTALLLSANAFIVGQRCAVDTVRVLEAAAENLADGVLLELTDGGAMPVPIERLKALEASSADVFVEGCYGWVVAIALLHPWQEAIVNLRSDGAAQVEDAGWHSQLFNVAIGITGVAVAELVAVVYTDGG